MKLFVAILAATALCAQTTVIVTGRVTDSRTGVPIAEASVGLDIAGYHRLVFTDQSGSFIFDDALPGNATFRVHKEGYIPYQTLTPTGNTIEANASHSEHNIQLTPASSIRGKIETDAKHPQGTTVYLFSENFEAGFASYARLAYQAVTPDGSFDFQGLEAGKYIIHARPARSMTRETDYVNACVVGENFGKCEELRAKEMEEVKKTPDEGYVTTWYPKSPDMAGATPLMLGAGETQTANIELLTRPLYHVSGEIGIPDEDLDHSGTSLQDPDSGQVLPVWMARIHGHFEMSGVPSGRYLAKLTSPGLQATLPVTVTDHDVDGVKLIPQPQVATNGRFRMDTPDTPLPANLSILFSWPLPGDLSAIPTASDGSFNLAGFPDDYSILPIVPAGYTATEIRYGGANYLNQLIPLKGDTIDPTLTVVLSNQPATVSGVTRESNAKIVLAPYPLPGNFDLRALRVAIPDNNGTFSFTSLPPGKYKAALLTGDDRKRDHDLTILTDKFAVTDAFELTAGQSAVVALK